MSRSVRVKARLMVQEQLMRRREALSAREARVSAQVLEATAAVLSRDTALAECERRLGAAVYALAVTEAVSVGDTAELCGLGVREVNRLLRSREVAAPVRIAPGAATVGTEAGEGER